jgi:hypothetical protein
MCKALYFISSASEKLQTLTACSLDHTSYSLNSHAINPDGNFFGHARADPAMLHSVLYLVALHRDLKYRISGPRDGLHHGAEAFRIINERLQANESFSDMTIAAVAMLANKEVSTHYLHLSLSTHDTHDVAIEYERKLSPL